LAPTVEEVSAEIDKLVVDNPGVVWAEEDLARTLFRRLKTTRQCVDSRLDTLVQQGSVVSVAVMPSGFVRLPEKDKELTSGMQFVSFHGRGGLGSGTLSYERRKSSGNLWAGDHGYPYYTSLEGYEAIRNKLAKEREELLARQAEKNKADAEEVKTALSEISEDATQLLDRLRGEFTEWDDVRVRKAHDGVALDISIRSSSVATFLDIIRRGLPEK
jgi:hypothetical protein